MQKGSIHMETTTITIKTRLNQAYHFSGAAGNGIRFSDLSDGPAFIFREDTSAVHNRFVPAGYSGNAGAEGFQGMVRFLQEL